MTRLVREDLLTPAQGIVDRASVFDSVAGQSEAVAREGINKRGFWRVFSATVPIRLPRGSRSRPMSLRFLFRLRRGDFLPGRRVPRKPWCSRSKDHVSIGIPFNHSDQTTCVGGAER